MRRCPNCNQQMESTALVAAFNDPPGWAFWGEPGARWKVCDGPGYIHFRVAVNGKTFHRLATIAPDVATPAPQPAPATSEPGRALPILEMIERKATNGDDWL